MDELRQQCSPQTQLCRRRCWIFDIFLRLVRANFVCSGLYTYFRFLFQFLLLFDNSFIWKWTVEIIYYESDMWIWFFFHMIKYYKNTYELYYRHWIIAIERCYSLFIKLAAFLYWKHKRYSQKITFDPRLYIYAILLYYFHDCSCCRSRDCIQTRPNETRPFYSASWREKSTIIARSAIKLAAINVPLAPTLLHARAICI